jgi:hypothetical protein
MPLNRVTITGADDSVRPLDLIQLSKEYPFVEWAILVSAKHTNSDGSPRFPSLAWLYELNAVMNPEVDLAMHVCGSWVRRLLLGTAPPALGEMFLFPFNRVQLNFHAESLDCMELPFLKALRAFGNRQIIFQIDGNMGGVFFNMAWPPSKSSQLLNAVPLFDMSHGAGVLPEAWPKPLGDIYHGYAGGLGPDNLAEQIPLILKASQGAWIWIDMETKVRSENDKQFDLVKVRRCLDAAAPFIKG